MGGGAAIRAAAKFAGTPSFTAAFRPSGGSVLDSPATLAARKALRPAPTTVYDIGLKAEEVQLPLWELDEWEFASVEDKQELLFVSDKNEGIKSPRVVFGPVPTIEETKQATVELKDALNKVYFSSPKSSEIAASPSSFHETKACITHESVPKGAMQAFRLLNESPAAQTVVASIASDPNVWVAVMQNPAFMEFLESDRKYADPETQESVKSSLDVESEAQASPKSSIDIDNAEEPGNPDVYTSFFQDVKVTVMDMVSSLTSFVDSLFSASEEKMDALSFDSPKSILAGGTFMALAMMVIMVVLMKRN